MKIILIKKKKVLLSIDKTFHNIDISFLEKIKGEEGNTYFINNKFNHANKFFLKKFLGDGECGMEMLMKEKKLNDECLNKRDDTKIYETDVKLR